MGLQKHSQEFGVLEDPFVNDVLNRKPLIEKLTNAISTIEQPFVISVNSPWGTGKTVFLDLWKFHLEQSQFRCLRFNAWATDFAEDPLISFMGELDEYLNETLTDKKSNEKIKKLWEETKSFGVGLVRKSLPLGIQLLSQGLVSASTIKELSENAEKFSELASDLAEEKLDQYLSDKSGFSEFRKKLTELADQITSSEEIQSPLVIMIDELDRCKPTYAIALLERLKHLFNVPGIVFILALDIEQLSFAVKSVYGEGFGAEGYLKRFIDYQYPLPNHEKSEFAHHLMNYFDLAKYTQNDFTYFEFVVAMINIFDLGLRDQEQFFTELNMITRSYRFGRRTYSYLVPFVVGLKLRDFKRYSQLGENSIEISTYIELFDDYVSKNSSNPAVPRLKALVEAWLIRFYATEKNRSKRLANAKATAETQDENPSSGVIYEREFLRLYDSIGESTFYDINYLARIKSHIDTLNPTV